MGDRKGHWIKLSKVRPLHSMFTLITGMLTTFITHIITNYHGISVKYEFAMQVFGAKSHLHHQRQLLG